MDNYRTVAETAEVLGISKDAVRKRIQRGTLDGQKVDGEWMVVLDSGGEVGRHEQDSHFWELIQQQREEIARLRQEMERKDAMIERLIERIPVALPPQHEKTARGWRWWPWNR